jgi:hypothetical protein
MAAKIFESPDGGRTVYSRDIGETPPQRVQIKFDDTDPRTWDRRPLHEHIMEDKMWGEIRRMARTDPGLQELLERVIVYYNLRKDHGN